MTDLKVKGVDPRAFSVGTLKPRKPLPYVSRKALKKVRDRLDPPVACHLCGSWKVVLTEHKKIYGRNYGDWPFLYHCENCSARVGLHKFTDIPLGTLADQELRNARQMSKVSFNLLLDVKFLGSRTAAYKWLAHKMGLPLSHCHFGFFTQEQCSKAWGIIMGELDCTV